MTSAEAGPPVTPAPGRTLTPGEYERNEQRCIDPALGSPCTCPAPAHTARGRPHTNAAAYCAACGAHWRLNRGPRHFPRHTLKPREFQEFILRTELARGRIRPDRAEHLLGTHCAVTLTGRRLGWYRADQPLPHGSYRAVYARDEADGTQLRLTEPQWLSGPAGWTLTLTHPQGAEARYGINCDHLETARAISLRLLTQFQAGVRP